MKLSIIGGSQGTGALLAELARDAGHEVTVVSRSGTAPAGVRTVVGSATDPAVAREAVTGADAIVITVGGAKGVRRQRAEVTRSVVAAMTETGARRLVVQSSLGAGDSGTQMPLPLRLVMKVLLAAPLADHNAQESVVATSGLDWTVVRPTGLTARPGTGSWRVHEVGDGGKLGGTIPRADLAAYLLEVLSDDALVGRAVGISS
ncbi:NAD(P)-dependent oxidoreductase [Rhodococcus sp. IEGM 1408]|uniref:NAD(P)-dependent oxidoreductase n=1 Tax=Rhodococcus sp. IEGM 1408 TaxID=3082220 RepID=UPI0029535400|nr:NAD(P)H-binding protein [Rhodococcus sp. IEGM 1408]MDV8002549.1 NAD(P)H-binding protein [Rhodococcus sp. IEGM 1408]